MNFQEPSSLDEILIEVTKQRPYFPLEDREEIASYIFSEYWLGRTDSYEDLIKEWIKNNKDWELERSFSFTAINDEGQVDEWILNKNAINEFNDPDIYDDEKRLKPSEELDIFLELLDLNEGVAEWVKGLYTELPMIMSKLSLRNERGQSNLLTKTITSRIL